MVEWILTDRDREIVIAHTLHRWTGWPTSPGVTLSFDDASRTFTVTDGGSAYYYIQGRKYTLGGNKTVTIGASGAEGIWFIYFSGATLTASQTPWELIDDDKALVAYLLWDEDNDESIFVGYELHGYIMDAATHEHMHHTIGALWAEGLAVSDAGSNVLNVAAGEIHDEDIEIAITDGNGGALFEQVLSPAEIPIYYISGSNWRKIETSDKNNATDIGYVSGTDLQYNKLNGSWALAAVSSAKYIAMWILATNEIAEPVVALMGQREDGTLADAIENNTFSGMTIDSALAQEATLLARVIIKESGSGLYYTLADITDYRGTQSIVGGGVTGANDHGALSGLGDNDHPHYHVRSYMLSLM